MRISTKGRYALRLMLDLALNQANEHAPIKDIAKRQEISAKYLEQIIPMLVKAGYVRSIRGSFGGYALCKSPEEYTIGMILRTTEGSLAPVPCLDNPSTACHRAANCVTIGRIPANSGGCGKRGRSHHARRSRGTLSSKSTDRLFYLNNTKITVDKL